ncbi:MAG TPA: response regulator [Treponema sp.]|nr:response regulator [Treponema sp.]HPC72034.1 response regulator [Treponema sp.]HRS04470.1 response regulator [Treponema sp.]HRU29683.1 response regulator [Treponema sp.]
MKLLIADDEKTIRAGLIKIITEHYPGTLEIIEAKNGEEAWTHICEQKPEILITDIRMPKMDGMELMRHVAALEEKPAMVVLSGYEEFSYARESIRLGVVNYILKPVDKQELFQILDSLIADIQEKERTNKQNLIASAIKGSMLQKDTLQELIRNGAYRIAQCIKPSDKQIANLITKNHAFIIEEKTNSLSLLVPEAERTALFSELQAQFHIIGVSDIIRNPADLQSCRTHAEIASFVRFFSAEKRLVLYEDLFEPQDQAAENRSLESLAVLVGTGDKTGIQRMLSSLFSFESESFYQNVMGLYQISSQIPSLLMTFHQYIETDPYLSMKSFLLRDMDRYTAIAELQKDISDLVLYLDILLQQRYSEYPFIEQALAFVAKHFTEPISMATVANHCSVNYTYFSEKFKQVVGVNFNDHVKQLRLEEAKRLLQQGCYKVYEVASRSGFGDVKYFMKAFKEATGLSPGEYQKRCNTQ